MIVEYLGEEPLTLDEVKAQCRVDGDDEDGYLASVVIPGARGLAEAKSGSAIRNGRYRDVAPDASRAILSVGGVMEIEAVEIDGAAVAYTAAFEACRTAVTVPGGAGKTATITYKAGVDIERHPGVKAWMLLAAGWLYAQRELLVGQQVVELPQHISDSLLASIAVPAGF